MIALPVVQDLPQPPQRTRQPRLDGAARPAQHLRGLLLVEIEEVAARDNLLVRRWEAPSSLGDGPGSPSTFNVTWLVHDVSVWRVDRVDIHRDGTVWVRTYEVDFDPGTGIDWESEPPWHQLSDAQAVIGVLNRLGVLDKTVVEFAEDTDTADTATVAGTTASGSGSSLGWWWMLPSVVVGVVVGIFGRPYLAAHMRRRAEPGPRQQLIDA
jgi:hypothetical protein